MQDRLFVVNKPIHISSNNFLSRIKRKYKQKKAGFSGTLDPFASGILVVAFGKYTKLFQYLNKEPKIYRATLWLGARSATLDIEKVDVIESVKPLEVSLIMGVLNQLQGEIEYIPPKFSAKWIDGKRAYDLAREGREITLQKVKSTIYSLKLLHYCHPFITFEATVSEGSYIRSIAQIICEELKTVGTLSALYRQKEGNFIYNKEKPLDPLEHLKVEENKFFGDENVFEMGQKIAIHQLEKKEDGVYVVKLQKTFSLIEVKDNEVNYLVNKVPYVDFIA